MLATLPTTFYNISGKYLLTLLESTELANYLEMYRRQILLVSLFSPVLYSLDASMH